jgi:hypothetical protein
MIRSKPKGRKGRQNSQQAQVRPAEILGTNAVSIPCPSPNSPEGAAICPCLELAAPAMIVRMIAVDNSPRMCRLTRENAHRAGVAIRVLRDDMCTFHLPERVDLVICEGDAIKHPVEKMDLCKFPSFLHPSAPYGSKITGRKSRIVDVMYLLRCKGRVDTGSIYKNGG